MLAATLAAAKTVVDAKAEETVDAKAEEVLAEAPAPPTRASHANNQVSIKATATNTARSRRGHRATSNHAFRVKNNSAKTHAARALTWASSATTSTNANRPAMCLLASRPLASHRAAAAVAVAGVVTAMGVAAVVVAAEAAIAAAVVAVVETGAEAAHARAVVVAVAAATRVAGFSADCPPTQATLAVDKKAALGCFFCAF